MFFTKFAVRQDLRPRSRRQPVVESLEGRQLLSSLGFTKVEMIQGGHIGTSIVGNHIGTSALKTTYGVDGIQGQHIGTNTVGQHIGFWMVQGGHVGTGVFEDAGAGTGGSERKH